ncbi:MAG: DUF1328 domain-containing protein [Phycisphaerae bacterium]
MKWMHWAIVLLIAAVLAGMYGFGLNTSPFASAMRVASMFLMVFAIAAGASGLATGRGKDLSDHP